MNVLYSVRRCASSSVRVQPSSARSGAAASHRSMAPSASAGIEREHDVAQSKQTARPEHRCHPAERYGLPEVRQVVKGVPAVYEIGRRSTMHVRQHPRLDELEVATLRVAGRRPQHCLRYVDGDHPIPEPRGGQRECARTGSQVHDRGARGQTKARQRGRIDAGRITGLSVVPRHKARIKMFGPRERDLVRVPARRFLARHDRTLTWPTRLTTTAAIPPPTIPSARSSSVSA